MRNILIGLSAIVTLAGCSFTTAQRTEIPKLEEQAAKLGHPEIKLKERYSRGTAAALGFLPFGIAGFYVERPGLGISGFLWPLSILWMPSAASNQAEYNNYVALKTEVTQIQDEALSQMLEEKNASNG